ncbi:MAG: alpha/beta hydrolase family protein, partial [Bdellovibrionales bacterium]
MKIKWSGIFSPLFVLAVMVAARQSPAAVYLPQQFQTEDGLTLNGHLALPSSGSKKFPVVLFLVGSGVVNRYEDVDGESTADRKPTLLFKGIEDRLLAMGVGVFAYDKRGGVPAGESFLSSRVTADFQTATATNLLSEQEARYFYEQILKRTERAIFDEALPW